MSFFMVVISGILDVFANIALQKSDGFKKIAWGIVSLILVNIAFLLLSFAISLDMDLPVAYTLWGSIGILGSAAGAYYFFKQKLKPIGIFGIILVVIAVSLLHS